MRVSDLLRTTLPIKEDVYIVGLGASLQEPMRKMATQFLADKWCILLNGAQEYFPFLGPVAFSNHKNFVQNRTDTIRYVVCKGRLKNDPNPERDDNHVSWDHPSFYVFSYREPPWDEKSHFDEYFLWNEQEPNHYWNHPKGSVSIFAVQFAVWMGCRSITLVGCDCCALGGNPYLDKGPEKQRKRQSRVKAIRRGIRPIPHYYDGYREGLTRIKQVAWERFQVPIHSMTPFIGLGYHEEQFEEMSKWYW